ncbi:MAG: cytochrome c biogenesis CcdA family protein [Terriglobia bacterium]
MNLSIATAFVAGLLSFLSPCVLPLVPGYISLISGISIEKLKEGGAAGSGASRAVLKGAVAFVLGFSVVFIAMGAAASSVGAFLLQNKTLLYKIAGVIIVFFGLFLLGVFKIGALYRERRFHEAGGRGPIGSFVLGLAFAFGWTPCIGPILGAILALAATRDTVAQGVFLLAIYSAGLAVPFLLTALGLNRFLAFSQGFRRHLLWVERTAGALMVVVGVLIFTNQLTRLSSYLAFLNRFAW